MDLSSNDLGKNVENMKWLGEGIRELPKNLQDLELRFVHNDLGENTENVRLLGEVMKVLPINLQLLRLNLEWN